MNNDFPRIKRLPPYVFNITNELKMAARHRGEDIIDLSMGNPDGDTPKHIVDKMIEVAQRPGTHGYSASRGIPRLRKAISADVRSVRMGPGIDFFSEFERAVTETTPKPKLMILGFPSNPTAQCVDLDFFEKLVALAKKHGVYIVHDLAYADIVYDGFKAPSIMQVPGAKDVAVEFFTMSKSYNMAGWRIGFMVGNRDLVGALTRIKSYHDYGTFTPIQVGAIEALNGPQECVEEVRKEYEHRRDVMVKGLHDLGWMVEKPKASMYIWAELPEFYKSMGSVEFSKRLLEKAKVAVSPGIGFGEYGEGFVRIALIENADRIRQALRGIRQMFKEDGLIQPKTKKFHRRWKGEPVRAVPEKKPAAPKFAKVKNIPTKSTKKPKAKAAAKKK